MRHAFPHTSAAEEEEVLCGRLPRKQHSKRPWGVVSVLMLQ